MTQSGALDQIYFAFYLCLRYNMLPKYQEGQIWGIVTYVIVSLFVFPQKTAPSNTRLTSLIYLPLGEIPGIQYLYSV